VILVVSYPGEDHTAEVIQRLEHQGREVVSIDLADFPAQAKVVLRWSADEATSYVVESANGTIDFKTARVGWWRRVRPFGVDKAVINPSMRVFAESETAQAVGGMLDALSCIWVNPRAADDAASHKPLQWAVAHELGLCLPRTLVTNNVDSARAFINEIGVGKTIFKPFLASIESWRETRLVQQQDLDKLESVKYAPVIFQEYVEGVDLRITVVGDSIYAAEIDARKTSYPVDMRMVVGEALVRQVTLPHKLQQSILKLQHRLGLRYGAIDMRRTAEGEYIFFEVNPAGQWLFVEQRTGMAISQAVADFLGSLHDQM
jgi:glutathione synthase/RimK-type ligase-like ATP-grasp enzyme